MSKNDRDRDVDETAQPIPISPASVVIQYTNDVEFDIQELVQAYARQWKSIVLTGFIVALLAFVLSFTIEKQYTTAVVTKLQPNPYLSNEPSLGAGSLISMALGGADGNSRIADALAILRGVSFPTRFAKKYELLPNMFAEKWNEELKKWEPERGPIKAITKIFSQRTNYAPTEMEVYDRFSNMLELEVSGNGDLLVFRTSWRSPELAVQLSNMVVKEINRELWERDVKVARELRRALYEEAKNESNLEIKAALFKSISRESEKLSFARANDPDEYLFSVLDGPYLPDSHSRPNRKIFFSAGLIAGLLLGLVLTSIRMRRQESR